tara:strand:+ start:1282 stop:3465 length:2184 start_codon:yes stop_codon:yes gene_type:complete
MSGHDFKFGREVGFFQRMFGQSFTPKEVDAIQRREDQRYSASFGTLENEFESALNDAAEKKIAPAAFNGDFGEFLAFKEDYEKNKGFGEGKNRFVTYSQAVTMLGKDRVHDLIPKDTLSKILETDADKQSGERKGLDFESTEFYRGEDGKTRVNPKIRTFRPGSGGRFKARTNNPTLDGAAQSETGDAGVGDLDLSQMDAIFEIGRNELLEKTGVYGTNNKVGAPFFEALTDKTRGAMESGNREDALPLVDQITNTLRNTLNYDIIDKAAGNELTGPGTTSTGTTSTGTTETTPLAVGSYNPSDADIKQAALGYFDPKTKRETTVSTRKIGFEKKLTTTRDQIQAIQKEIDDGKGNPRNTRTLERLKKQFDNLVVEGQNNDIRENLKTKLDTATGENKTKYGQILAGPNFDRLVKSKELREEIQNLSPDEFIQKYSSADGTLNKEALFGQDFIEPEKEILKKTITNAELKQITDAIENKDEAKARELMGKLNFTEEDEQTLIQSLNRTGGDYRNASDAFLRRMYILTLKNAPTESALSKALFRDVNLATLTETGFLNNNALSAVTSARSSDAGNFDARLADVTSLLNKDLEGKVDISQGNGAFRYNAALNIMKRDIRTQAQADQYYDFRAEQYKRVIGAEFDSVGWLAYITSLGRAEGADPAVYSDGLQSLTVVQNRSGDVIGFRANQAYQDANSLIKQYGQEYVNKLAKAIIRFEDAKVEKQTRGR